MSRSNLPFVSSSIPPDLRQFLERVRESLDGDTYVRRTDYVQGTVPRYPGEPLTPPSPPPNEIFLPCGSPVTPTTPTGFYVTPGFSGFLLSWDMPAYCGHDRTEVYALRRNGSASELTELNMLGESRGVMYSHVCDQADAYWCFWIRHVNVEDVEGPFNGTLGVCARTAIQPEPILDALRGQITETTLYRHLGDRIDLIDLPGTGLIDQVTLLSTETEELARRIEEISARQGSRVFFRATEPPVNFCTINGIVAPAYTTELTCVDNGGVWLTLRINDMWYKTAADPLLMLLYRWSGVAWVVQRNAVKVFYQAEAPDLVAFPELTTGDLWYDTDDNNRPYRWDGDSWELLLDGYLDGAIEAKILNFEQTKIGYCTVGGVTTDADTKDLCEASGTCSLSGYLTKATCEAAGGTWSAIWHQGLPWASAIKQVSIDGAPYCIVDGEKSSHVTLVGCTGAGGTWIDPGSVVIQQAFEALQQATGELYAQYSIKIDQNGFVSGFGLSSETTVNGTPYSNFLVRADRFAIASPTAPNATKTISSLTRAGTTATCTTTTAHGLVSGDNFAVFGSSDAGWNKAFVVSWTPSTTQIAFTVPNTLPTPATAAPGKTLGLQKIAVPFIVTTTGVCLVGGVNRTGDYPTEVACTAVKGLWVPAGTYIDDAYINSAVISWAQIDNATIDYAIITDAVVGDLLANDITVSECIRSASIYSGTTPNWQICGDGSALFNNATVRGAFYGGASGFTDGNPGVFIGNEGGVYKFRVGDGNVTPVGTSLRWNGANLNVFGAGGAQLMRFGSSLADCFLRSGNYSAGTSGWTINGDGTAEFDTIHLRSGAITSMYFLPLEGQVLPSVDLIGYGVWTSGTAYAVGDKIYVTDKTVVYRCILAHTSSALNRPPNATYWAIFYQFQTLASLYINPALFANKSAGLGATFFTRFTATAIPTFAMTTNDIIDRPYGSSLLVRLVGNTGSGETNIYAAGSLSLPPVGRQPGTNRAVFQLHYSSMEFVGNPSGYFYLRAANAEGLVDLTITITDIAFGYVGMKR
jgi:hypothetical protein